MHSEDGKAFSDRLAVAEGVAQIFHVIERGDKIHLTCVDPNQWMLFYSQGRAKDGKISFSLDEIIDNRLDETARELGDYLSSKLETLKKHGVVREVRGRGVICGVELTKNPDTLEPFSELSKALKTTALENGRILRVDPNWFTVCPALIAEKEGIDELCDLIEKSLLEGLNRV